MTPRVFLKTPGLLALVALLLAHYPAWGAGAEPLHKLDPAARQARFAADRAAVLAHRQGLLDVLTWMETQPEIFSRPDPDKLLNTDQKLRAWNAWQRFLDYQLALESIERYHASFHRLKGQPREDSFMLGYAALTARYRGALAFFDAADANPGLEKVLNDSVPELGLPAGTYARFKAKYLNVSMPAGFAARELIYETFPRDREPLRPTIDLDAREVRRTGRARGTVLTLKNALTVVQSGASAAWLPVQTGVAEWMGDTKVYRPKRSLISKAQIEDLAKILQPGDILLERREWYLSNIGLPGFWSHAALYIGSPEQRRSFFSDPATRAWVRGQGRADADFEGLLTDYYPALPPASLRALRPGESARVLEAISEGVSFTSLEHSADCDSLAVLRPRLPKPELARAILRAYAYAGRPYDFEFDFATDARLVCTELVFKAYEPGPNCSGLNLPLVEVLGRKVTPANEIVKQFDTLAGTPNQQLDLVIFLDGHERNRHAVKASLEAFRTSWQRPKWHILIQK